jgi:hypothetical protein
VGVTSSILPIFMPERARARRADWAPGPGVLVPLPRENGSVIVTAYSSANFLPPVARILMWRALMPNSLHRVATSCAANIAAYGEDSSRSALTFMPPVTRVMVSRPLESPRKSAYEPFHKHAQYIYANVPIFIFQGCTDLRSVTWTKVSLKDAKILATPKTSSPVGLLALRNTRTIAQK